MKYRAHREPLRREGILRIPDVEALTGYRRSSLYRLEAEGRFPNRVKLGVGRGGAVGFRARDVEEWLEARMDGRDWAPAATERDAAE